MAYNTLSGTVVANRTIVFKENGGERDEAVRNMVRGEFHGDGTYIENVARVVADGVNDYVVTVGNTQQSLVGEQNLRFNGSRLYINGFLTASAMQLNGLSTQGGLSSSFLVLDSNNNIVLTSSNGPIDTSSFGSATGTGPLYSIQIHTGSGGISGSLEFTYNPVSNAVQLGGDLIVTGTIRADTFDIRHTNITEIDASGSTHFGNSDDDTHTFSGSLSVVSSSNIQFQVNATDNTTSINTGVIFNRIAVSSSYAVAKHNHIVGVDSTNGPVTITLPDASLVENGQVFVIKDEGGASYSNNITIQADGTQKINGANMAVLNTPYTAIHIYSNGQNKFFTY